MLNKSEKDIVLTFKKKNYPNFFKLDNTDNILYIEHVDFDLCDALLKNIKVNIWDVQNELKLYANFLLKLDISACDEETKEYIGFLMQVVTIFINFNF